MEVLAMISMKTRRPVKNPKSSLLWAPNVASVVETKPEIQSHCFQHGKQFRFRPFCGGTPAKFLQRVQEPA